MRELTNVLLLELISDCVAGGLDDRAAFNKLRSEYSQNGIPGRSAAERQENFVATLERFRTRPAALKLALRNARVEQFKADLMEAFDSCTVEDADLEDHYGTLTKALQHPGAVPEALLWLDELGASNPALGVTHKRLWPAKESSDE